MTYVGYCGLPPRPPCRRNPRRWRRTPRECCNEARKDLRIHHRIAGGIVCCDGRQVACVFNIRRVDPEADPLIRECVQRHENTHLGQPKSCVHRPWQTLYRAEKECPDPDFTEGECFALDVSLECLLEAEALCTTESCRRGIKRRRATVESRWKLLGCDDVQPSGTVRQPPASNSRVDNPTIDSRP